MAVRQVDKIFHGVPASDGAGVRMTRVIASPELDHFDPFLLLDEFRSDDPGDYIAGFPDHPHRGFETVTYMLAGNMQHGDSQGNQGVLGPGSVQWMTAGRGIVHSEMPQQEEGLMWGFQLWVNLPARRKMIDPRYQDIPAASVPSATVADGVTAKVIAGELAGVKGPVSGVDTEPLFFDIELAAGASVELPVPARHNVFVYVYEGSLIAGGTATVAEKQIALTGEGDHLRLEAAGAATSALVVGGRPLGEPIARYGPFVMNTEAELRQAFSDYQQGRFTA